MDKVIETLNTIEERAARIMEVTVNEKNSLRDEYSQKIAEYEKKANEDMQDKLKALKTELDRQTVAEIEKQEQNSIKDIDTLKSYYEEHHSKLAEKIFNSIIGA